MIKNPSLKKFYGTWGKSNQETLTDRLENIFQSHEIECVKEFLAITEIPNSMIQFVTPKEVKT